MSGRQNIVHDAAVAESDVTELELRVGQLSRRQRVGISLVLLLVALMALTVAMLFARGSPVHGVLVEGSRAAPPSTRDPLFARQMELHAGANFQTGNHVELLLNGDGTFPRIWSDIRAAEKSVTVQMYYFTPGALCDTIGAVLRERARSGVRVLLLLDAFGARTVERSWLDSLRAAGASIAHLRPLQWYKLERLSHRSHVRGIVVDGRIGYTGGYGFGDYWLGNADSPDHWRETNVRIVGPAVQQLQASFTAGWAEATGELLTGDLFFADADTSGGLNASLMYFAPTPGSSEAERFLAVSIAAARSSLYITNSYFIPDVQMVRMLIAAAQRGVDVRILTAGERTDIKMAVLAARARYDELLAAGIRIYEYQPTMIHAKTIVVDGIWSSVGSMNFDNRSLAYNDEAQIGIIDEGFSTRLTELFMRDLEQALEITLPEFRKRSAWDRIQEWSANLLSGLL